MRPAPASIAPRRADLLRELETQLDDALLQLDALNAQIEKLIAAYTAEMPTPPVAQAA